MNAGELYNICNYIYEDLNYKIKENILLTLRDSYFLKCSNTVREIAHMKEFLNIEDMKLFTLLAEEVSTLCYIIDNNVTRIDHQLNTDVLIRTYSEELYEDYRNDSINMVRLLETCERVLPLYQKGYVLKPSHTLAMDKAKVMEDEGNLRKLLRRISKHEEYSKFYRYSGLVYIDLILKDDTLLIYNLRKLLDEFKIAPTDSYIKLIYKHSDMLIDKNVPIDYINVNEYIYKLADDVLHKRINILG